MNVNSIRDQLRVQLPTQKRGAHHSRLSVMKPGHRVETVRHMPRTEIDCVHRLTEGGGRVTDRHLDLMLSQEPHSHLASRLLRRERCDPDRTIGSSEQIIHSSFRGWSNVALILCSLKVSGDPWAFDVYPDGLCSSLSGARLRAHVLVYSSDYPIDLVKTRGHGREEEARDPVGAEPFRHVSQRILCGIHGVRAPDPVNVEIDEARSDEIRSEVESRVKTAGLHHVLDEAVLDDDLTTRQETIRKYKCPLYDARAHAIQYP